jgi:TRAP-type C4-dicarboxylate transport system permease small subunit
MPATPPSDNRKTPFDPIAIFANRLSAWAGAAVLALLILVVIDAVIRRLLGSSNIALTDGATLLVITCATLPLAAAINAGRLARMDLLSDLLGGPATRSAQFVSGICAFLGVVAVGILALAASAYIAATVPRAIILVAASAAAIVCLRNVYRSMMAATAPRDRAGPRR